MTTEGVVLFPKMKHTQLPFLSQELITTRSYMTHFLTNERSSHAGCKCQEKMLSFLWGNSLVLY